MSDGCAGVMDRRAVKPCMGSVLVFPHGNVGKLLSFSPSLLNLLLYALFILVSVIVSYFCLRKLVLLQAKLHCMRAVKWSRVSNM